MSARLILALLALIALVGCSRPAASQSALPTEIPRVTILPTPAPQTPTPARPTQPPSTPTPQAPSPTPIDLATPTPVVTLTPAATPTLSPGATPFEGCVNGWIRPEPGSAEYEEGLEILGGYMGTTGPWAVDEMRYFVGPDSPGVIEPFFPAVERWYIRAALESDPSFRGRFIIEKRTETILGVSAVAPWDTVGYESPDWTSFIGEGPPTVYINLPGQWSGIPFNFVTGEGDGGQPGLPSEVVDCLAGT